MKNTEGLQRYSQQRSEETIQKVNKAIASLKRSKKKITIAEVARKACVSKATIYNNPIYKERITELKSILGTNTPDDMKNPLKRTSEPNITKIDELKIKNAKLKEEIETLRTEKGLLLGQLKNMASENLELKASLKQYRNIKKLH